ncbi:hypothetical protein B7463_g4420, partial [Scytalidium lignicola]
MAVGMMEFFQRFQALQSQRVTSDELIKNRNPYVVALFDGDGMIFHQDFVRQGLEGGKKAANALRNVIFEHCKGITEETEVIAKVYANISGLAKAMVRNGCIDKPDEFKEFTLGFTQGKASFDFIDVGHGKERADSKIRGEPSPSIPSSDRTDKLVEATRWNIRNHNCKQILLGISHDSGYAPFLDDVVRQDDRCPVAIIEGSPTVRELTATGLPVINLTKDLFRGEKLVDRTTTTSAAPAPSTWAGVSSIATLPLSKPPVISVKSSPLPVKSTPSLEVIWDPGPRGLDPPLMVNPVVVQEVKKRTPKKLCNFWYLRGECNNRECAFEHDHDATGEELDALAFLNRLHPCSNGQECVLDNCIYGHHCPSTISRPNQPPLCNAYGCKFYKEDHPPDTRYKHSNSPNTEYGYN